MFRLDGRKIALLLDAAGIPYGAAARQDANETALFARSLETISAKIYRIEYPDLKARSLFPVNNEADPADDKYTWRQYDISGEARIVNNWATDAPTVEIVGAELSHSFKSITAAYWYSVQDVRKSAKTGFPLEVTKASAAREVMEQKLEAIAAVGAPNEGILTGFTNAPGILPVTVGTGAGGNTWAQKTPAEVVKDINLMQRAIFSATKGRYQADTLVLGSSNFAYAGTEPRAPGFTDDSIMQYILKQSPWLKAIEFWPRLDTAGASSKERIMLYKRDPSVVELLMSQEFEQFPPQIRNLAFLVNCHMRTAGVVVRRPKAIAFMDGTVP